MSADLKAEVEQSDDSGVRKLAAPERAQRHKQQQERLQGIDISGAHAPGDIPFDPVSCGGQVGSRRFAEAGTMRKAVPDHPGDSDADGHLPAEAG